MYIFRLEEPLLERLCRSCPKLAVLSLPNSCDDACIETVLRGLRGLRSLDIDISKLTGRCLTMLPASLQRLGLSGHWNLHPAELDKLPCCPEMTEMDISDIYRPAPCQLVKLLSLCPRLEKLKAQDTDITDPFLEALPEKTPGIRYLGLQGQYSFASLCSSSSSSV